MDQLDFVNIYLLNEIHFLPYTKPRVANDYLHESQVEHSSITYHLLFSDFDRNIWNVVVSLRSFWAGLFILVMGSLWNHTLIISCTTTLGYFCYSLGEVTPQIEPDLWIKLYHAGHYAAKSSFWWFMYKKESRWRPKYHCLQTLESYSGILMNICTMEIRLW